MKFDTTLTRKDSLDYEILYGNEKIVFIKCGRGGSYQGHDEKYAKMAEHLHAKRGCTVICASNPIEHDKSYDVDKAVIGDIIAKKQWTDFEIDLIGSSNGAYQNLFLANQLPRLKKILCINMPLMINFHKITEQLQALETVEKTFVYGTKDPSYVYLPMLEMKHYPLFRAIRAQDADHLFQNKTADFIALSDLL